MIFFKAYLSFICFAIMIFAGCKKDNPPPPPTAPVVTTAALTNVNYNGATAGGSIVSDGGASITASGVVWSKTNATPTLADSVVAGTIATGTFTSDLIGLEENSSYYIRAFATNSVGTGYGNVVTLNTTNDTNKVRFTYNGEEVVYGIVVSPTTGRKWLDRNLGAKQVATGFDDYLAYGDLFQWGRNDDGHQLINWTSSTAGSPVSDVTTTLATSDNPGHNSFITPPFVDPYDADWRDDNNRNRWVTTPQGPCPAGWHVPTREEWAAEVYIMLSPNNVSQTGGTATSGGISSRSTAYSLIKLTANALRLGFDYPDQGWVGGQLLNPGLHGRYWTSSDQSADGRSEGYFMWIHGNDIIEVLRNITFSQKSFGMSIRCIKD